MTLDIFVVFEWVHDSVIGVYDTVRKKVPGVRKSSGVWPGAGGGGDTACCIFDLSSGVRGHDVLLRNRLVDGWKDLGDVPVRGTSSEAKYVNPENRSWPPKLLEWLLGGQLLVDLSKGQPRWETETPVGHRLMLERQPEAGEGGHLHSSFLTPRTPSLLSS